MLDVHASTVTPGAATVLGSPATTVAVGGDGQIVAGLPIVTQAGAAKLTLWGGLSISADTIGNLKLQSQDMIDPINGETVTTGAASLLNAVNEWTQLTYKTGIRNISMGTNTGVTACSVYTIDLYADNCPQKPVQLSRKMANKVITPVTTFGGALTTNQWSTVVYSPTNQLPAGRYALVGARVGAIANAALLRFQHADFGQYMPGFPVSNYETISTSTWDKIDKEDLFLTQAGTQFIYLGEVLGVPCCPVFRVGNAGTGLTIWMLSAQADTPTVTLDLVYLGA
jgi:hypothetical protein